MRPNHNDGRSRLVACVVGLAVSLAWLPTAAAQGFATQVVAYDPGNGVGAGFDDPLRALGGPTGEGDNNGSVDVVTLGVQGSITLGFDATLFNGDGADLTVFENGFFFGGGFYGELGFVEVSSNGVHWARFASESHVPGPLGPFDTYDPSLVAGLAGNAPVYANVQTNSIDPFDPAVSGGNAFDLDDLAADALVLSGDVDLQSIAYVRIVDVFGDGATLDSQGGPIYDPTNETVSFDLDAVAALHQNAMVTVAERQWGAVKALYR